MVDQGLCLQSLRPQWSVYMIDQGIGRGVSICLSIFLNECCVQISIVVYFSLSCMLLPYPITKDAMMFCCLD